MVAVMMCVQRFDVKTLYTRARATDGSAIARAARTPSSVVGKGLNTGKLHLKHFQNMENSDMRAALQSRCKAKCTHSYFCIFLSADF